MTTKVLVVGADPALAELLEEWLTLESCRAVAERPDVVLVDVPFPRELAVQRLPHIGDEHPGTPVLPMPKTPNPGRVRGGAAPRKGCGSVTGTAAGSPMTAARVGLTALHRLFAVAQFVAASGPRAHAAV